MTKNKIKKTKIIEIFYIFIILLCILMLTIMPSIAMHSFFDGIRIWATKVLPALLPFFILTRLLSYTTFISNFGNIISPLTKKLYGVGGASGYVYLMSIISGYPVGAKLLSDLYTQNTISRRQAITITSFTSTSGPLFILGTVAIGLFNNVSYGIIIIISHYIGALINGLFYRDRKSIDINIQNTHFSENYLNESMSNSIASIMSVGGFIALFYMILQIILETNIFSPLISVIDRIGISNEITTATICGLIEVTTGAIYLSKIQLSQIIIVPLLTFIISFGGLSIHAQAFCFLKNFNMPYPLFLLQKFSQAIISTIFSIILAIIFL